MALGVEAAPHGGLALLRDSSMLSLLPQPTQKPGLKGLKALGSQSSDFLSC